MNPDYLEFEQPIAELEYKLAELRQFSSQTEVDLGDEITRLQNKTKTLTESIFAGLNDWQIAQLARHPQRPYTLDYIKEAFTDYRELHGDRHYGDDHAIVGGLARLNGRAVMIIGHEKGRDTKEKVRRNFGMPRPEGYRKALRLMKLAERFGLPLITFIDTPGAYPGIGADHRRRHRRRRQRRRARHRRGRPRADAAIRHVFRHLAGRLRLHPLAQRGKSGGSGRNHASYLRQTGKTRPD